MEFNFFVKDHEIYKKLCIIPPSGSGWEYLKGLKMTIEKELNGIREEIISVCGVDTTVSLSIPRIDNVKKQEKVDKLVEIRKTNLDTKRQIDILLSDEEFIFCEHCKGKMYKTPVNCQYIKYGHRFIIDEPNLQNIKYSFMCETCPFAVSEDMFLFFERNKLTRKNLLERGYNFVPNDFLIFFI